MTTRFGSTLSLPKGARKVTPPAPVEVTAEPVIEVTQERTHRPPVGARRFSRSKALADGLTALLKDADQSGWDRPGDINGNC